jgi:hypothetical protein
MMKHLLDTVYRFTYRKQGRKEVVKGHCWVKVKELAIAITEKPHPRGKRE